MTDDPAWLLTRHVCRTGCADLPASAVASAHRDILDTLGCMLGGSGSPGIGELFAVVSRWGGLAESRVLLRGIRLPVPQAVLLNASMGHALDFDDTLDTGGSIHPGVSVLDGLGDPSVLALSDRITGAARDGRAKGSLAITVRRTNRRSITVEATDPIGSPQKPLTQAQFAAKFRDARAMPCGRCRMPVWKGCLRRSDGWKRCRMRGS